MVRLTLLYVTVLADVSAGFIVDIRPSRDVLYSYSVKRVLFTEGMFNKSLCSKYNYVNTVATLLFFLFSVDSLCTGIA